MNAARACSIAGCEKPHRGLGYCRTHYDRLKRTGDPNGTRRPTQTQAFWSKVEKSDDCWLWTGTLDHAGYGCIWHQTERRMVFAHRMSYEMHVGSIPPQMEIDHTCKVRGCVNPEHMRLATHKQNAENRTYQHGKSGVRGVWQRDGKWRARVRHNGTSYSLGTFNDLAAAERAVVAKRNELFTHNDEDRR